MSSRFKKLNAQGFDHVIVPVIFIVLFAIIGTAYFVISHAATTTISSVLDSGISGKCLDNWHDGSTNGNKIDLYSCNGTAAQKWTVVGKLVESSTGKCLDNWQDKDTNDNHIALYKCSSTDKAEQWNLVNNTIVSNQYTKKCVDDPDSSTTNGTQLILYTCNGGKNQTWKVATTTAPVAPTPTPTAPVTSQSCTNPTYTTSSNLAWNNDGYTVQQDMWNNNSGGTQSLYACGYNNWYVVADQPNTSSVKTYPDVLKNFNNPINTFTTLSSSFAEQAPHVGIYEYAYDIWINGMATSGATELMIWQDNYHQYPAGSVVGQTTISGVTYNIYKGNVGWQYIAFVPTNATISSATVNILPFFNYISGQGWISTDATLEQIDFGIEVCSTDGSPATFKVTNYSITSATN